MGQRLGQHFLKDNQLIQYWVEAMGLDLNDEVVEIGPGQGALTIPLLKQLSQLAVIEYDQTLVPALKANCQPFQGLTIHTGDALAFDYSTLGQTPHGLRVVGNLPYEITTPLLFHLLKYRFWIADMHFLLQKEVVARLTAEPGSSTYNRLSVMTQYYCQTKPLRTVPPEVFSPPPTVDSQFVRLMPYQDRNPTVSDEMLFARVVRQAFQKRRKTLRNALKGMMSTELIKSAGIDPNARPQTVTVEGFIRLTEAARLED